MSRRPSLAELVRSPPPEPPSPLRAAMADVHRASADISRRQEQAQQARQQAVLAGQALQEAYDRYTAANRRLTEILKNTRAPEQEIMT